MLDFTDDTVIDDLACFPSEHSFNRNTYTCNRYTQHETFFQNFRQCADGHHQGFQDIRRRSKDASTETR